MAIVLPLFLGFCIAFLAVILPGLINMTAAKISLEEGKSQAMSFAIGASVIVFFQTYLAVLFARFISSHVEIISLLQEIGILIFTGLSVYFFWIAKKPKNQKQLLKSKGNRTVFSSAYWCRCWTFSRSHFTFLPALVLPAPDIFTLSAMRFWISC